MQHYILRIVCPDRKGLIFNTMKILLKYNSNILENEEFVDESNSTFFMRTEFILDGNVIELKKELELFFQDASKLELFPKQKKKLWVLVTKEHHCLSDILLKSFHGDWNAVVKGVISNHETLRAFSELFRYKYYFVSHENKTREEMEREIASAIDSQGEFDYIVLAKYMRIFSKTFVDRYKHKIVNIHHSFLPAFVGARPYKQAFDRGVKIIGATAHFVTENLDEGPIIQQGVIPVDHTYTEEDLKNSGKDVEVRVLSEAIKLLLEDRVFINGNKTVIL